MKRKRVHRAVSAIPFYSTRRIDSESKMARDESRLDQRLFTVNERILLHLKESGSASQTIDVPAPMTQDGIANALAIRVNHVSRAAKTLQKQGLIREATARVKGEIRRRKIYLITAEGMAVANNIHRRVSETLVSIRDSRQRLREMPAGEARKLLLPPRTFTAMLAALDERNVLDIFRAKAKKKETEAVSHIVGAPAEAPFHGRIDELKKVRSWLQLREPPVLVIIGARGIGKTMLAKRSVDSLEGRRPVFWFSITPATTAGRLAGALSDFLHKIGRIDFRIEEHDGIDDLGKKFEASLIDLGALFVIDDLLDELEDVVDVTHALVEAVAATGNQTLITARTMPHWGRSMKTQKLLEEVLLRGLDKDSCRRIAPQLEEEEFNKAYRLARGNPLEIKLLSEYADEEVNAKGLTPEERALMRYLKAVHESDVR